MSIGQRTAGMRPNIDISHTLNGRVKDYADRHDINLTEAYEIVIETGISELEDRAPEDDRNV